VLVVVVKLDVPGRDRLVCLQIVFDMVGAQLLVLIVHFHFAIRNHNAALLALLAGRKGCGPSVRPGGIACAQSLG